MRASWSLERALRAAPSRSSRALDGVRSGRSSPVRSLRPRVKVITHAAESILGLSKSLRALRRGVELPGSRGVLLFLGRLGRLGHAGGSGGGRRRQEGEGQRRGKEQSAGPERWFLSPRGRGAPRRGTFGRAIPRWRVEGSLDAGMQPYIVRKSRPKDRQSRPSTSRRVRVVSGSGGSQPARGANLGRSRCSSERYGGNWYRRVCRFFDG